MKLQPSITTKLTLVFVLFAALLLVGVGALAYTNGRTALEAATVSYLLSTAIDKEANLNAWVAGRQMAITELAHLPDMSEDAAALIAAAPTSAKAKAAHDHLVGELQTWAGPGQQYLALLFIEAKTGQVMAATTPDEEGKFKEDRPYFINGKSGPYVQDLYYSLTLQELAMTVAAPLRSSQGQLLGVLAGRLNLAEMNAIVNRRTGLRQTEDAFLVNSSNLFATQPRFITDPVVLRRGVHTEAVKRCLAPGSGDISVEDYRGVPAIIVYRWLPNRHFCLLVKIDQAEALAPIHTLGQAILLIGGLALLLAVVAAGGLAHTITRPVLALQAGAARFGQGELDVRMPETSGDELGQLAHEFNTMASAMAEVVHEQVYMLDMAQMLTRAIDDSHIMLWSLGAEKLYGFTKAEALGRVSYELLQTEFPEPLEQIEAKFHQTGTWTGELINFKRDGSRVVVTSLWVLYRDAQGRPRRILEANIDITARKQAEEASHEREKKLSTLFEILPVGISILDADRKISRVNPALKKIMGLSEEDILKDTYGNWKYLNETGAPMPADGFATVQVLRDKRTIHNVETGIIKEDGTIIWVNVSAVPVEFPDWKIVVVTSDITKRKRAENELRQTAAELARSNAELEQFAYIASHDLQEPLRAVASTVQLLQRRYGGQLDARADEFIRHAVEGAARMQTLIADLLNFSRVGTRGQPFQSTDCAEVLIAVLANLTVAIQESQASITHDPLPSVLADRTQLIQLFQNLLGNAIKFRGDNAPVVHIGVEQQETEYLFAVRDNGIGLEGEYFERIFGVFQRLHTRQEYPGTGIGLAVCKKIVERHGGHIWLESEPGQGSIFYFTMPDRR